mgnify:CR=1 FL=1
MEKVEVEGVILNPRTITSIVLLSASGDRVLPIVVGLFEAQAILMGLQKGVFPRPLTHDLLQSVIRQMGGRLVRMEIYALKEEVYYAHLVISVAGEERVVDCRPSDGIALALRCNAPIYAAEELLERRIPQEIEGHRFIRRRTDKPIDEKEVEEFSRLIESMSAEDFWKHLNTKGDPEQSG